jgi:hypothetical protein
MAGARAIVMALLAWAALTLAAAAEPASYRTGIFVSSLSNIDAADGSFRISAYVWFVGPPDRFDPATELQVMARSASVQVVTRKLLPDGSQYAVVRIEALVNQNFDLRHFPFDRQALRLLIETSADTDQLHLVPDTADSRIADFVTVPVWTIGELKLEPSEYAYDTGFGYRTTKPSFSRMAFVIDISRGRTVLLMEKFAGFVVSLILTLFIFFVPPREIGIRVGIVTSSVFAAVFNRYRLEDRIGFDASFGLVDQVSLLTFAAVLAALAISLYVFNLTTRRPLAEVAALHRRLGQILLAVTLLGFALAFGRALS